MRRPTAQVLLVSFFLCLNTIAWGQRREAEPFDILHFQFEVNLNDTTDVVEVSASISLAYPDTVPEYTILDLANRSGATGMQVDEMRINDQTATFIHESDQLKINTPSTLQKGDTILLSMVYSGIPDNGLVISKNAYGDRTFFAEHWPNRAHRWLPVVDHPSEKATCEFVVNTPSKYRVVANGDLQSEEDIIPGWKRTIWKMDQPISAKVMVIGVAQFMTKALDDQGLITAWVYEKSGKRALDELAEAPAVFEILTDLLGEYPFSKCDQVESTTRFGGMENAGNIFYPETSLTGDRNIDETIAHEIGHQWFGDAVTEADWADLWISEGFATFLANYWILESLGKDALLANLEKDEAKILNYQRANPSHTVIQKDFSDLDKLMNALTYDKAAWVLRTLHQKVGKETFRQIILTFYQRYKYSIASTQDFVNVASEVSLLDLNSFFQQWFYVAGAPEVEYHWKYRRGKLIFEFEQRTDYVYHLDVDIQVKYESMNFEIMRVALNQRSQSFEIPCERIAEIEVDPLNIILGKFHKR